ncbi:MAG: M23 family metallopeptidase [Flavobacteriaceae bacterium]|nr:M23 family metallopeptidase [Flavobacteriaceae bacterium]
MTKDSPLYSPDRINLFEQLKFPLDKLKRRFKYIRSALIFTIAVLVGISIEFVFMSRQLDKFDGNGITSILESWQGKIDSITQIHTQTIQYLNKIEATFSGNLLFQNLPEEKNLDLIPKKVSSSKLDPEELNSRLIDGYPIKTNIQLINNEYNLDIEGNLVPPIRGAITDKFDPNENHFGVDIAATKDSPIVTVADGVVVLSEYTLETGFVIMIKHSENLLTVYKHNSALKKKQGETVKGGEIIAFGGDTGELSTGPHLHFEMWINNQPVDPLYYFTF